MSYPLFIILIIYFQLSYFRYFVNRKCLNAEKYGTIAKKLIKRVKIYRLLAYEQS